MDEAPAYLFPMYDEPGIGNRELWMALEDDGPTPYSLDAEVRRFGEHLDRPAALVTRPPQRS
ncbi:MAG: hypothetical protein M3513_18290 [Actinomycetota bacterium]|nr:hypothetical protein [Actinomycetota bacterium]